MNVATEAPPRTRPSRRRLRGWLVQAVVLAALVALLATGVLLTRQNLLDQGIATGFAFLERSTGWPISFALIEVSDRSSYARMLYAGLLNTLLVGLLGLLCATVVGVAVGFARVSSNFVLNALGTVYVELFRNVPLILQAFVWYALLTHLPSPRQAFSIADVAFLSNRGLMLPTVQLGVAAWLGLGLGVVAALAAASIIRRRSGSLGARGATVAVAAIATLGVGVFYAGGGSLSLPSLQGLRFTGGMTVKPEFTALLIAITVFGGAYIGEIVRGGFLAVDHGKLEAARALGLRPFSVNRLVRLPLAVRAMLPALSNQYVWLMKATTIGIAIGFPDYFMVVSTSINQSGQTIELLALLMGGFLLVNYAIAFTMNRINAYFAARGGVA